MIVTTCSKCPAKIVWATSENGKKMPMDAEPSPDGSFVLVESPDDGTLLAVFHKKAHGYMPSGEVRAAAKHTSHHATCPYADHFRRRT
jgi:hypothetical protein